MNMLMPLFAMLFAGMFPGVLTPPTDDQPEKCTTKHMIVRVQTPGTEGAEGIQFAEGETKTFEKGGRTVVVTRKDGKLTVTCDGKEMSAVEIASDALVSVQEGDGHVALCCKDGGMEKMILTELAEGAAKGEHVCVVKVKKDGDAVACAEGGQAVQVDGKECKVVRDGDGIKIYLDGKELALPLDKIHCQDGKALYYVTVADDGKAGDGQVVQKKIIVTIDDQDGKKEEKKDEPRNDMP